jgi:hypothetical protein
MAQQAGSPAFSAFAIAAHSGDPGHPFRLKADAAPEESGHGPG